MRWHGAKPAITDLRKVACLTQVLAALWDHSGEGSGSIFKPSTAERLDSFASGCNVGLISASRSGLTMDVNQGRGSNLWAYIWPRFGSIDVDVRFSEHGPLQTQTLTERCYLLLWGKGFRQWQSQRILTPVWSNPRSGTCPL